MIISNGDFEDPQVIELLRSHLSSMQQNSPSDSVYALNYSDLQHPTISFWTASEDNLLVGCGALRELSSRHGEIKSMRTHENHLRKGVAANMLKHIVNIARSRAYQRLSLETGSGPAFEPAIQLYKKFGFVPGEPFAEYKSSEFNQFLHLIV